MRKISNINNYSEPSKIVNINSIIKNKKRKFTLTVITRILIAIITSATFVLASIALKASILIWLSPIAGVIAAFLPNAVNSNIHSSKPDIQKRYNQKPYIEPEKNDEINKTYENKYLSKDETFYQVVKEMRKTLLKKDILTFDLNLEDFDIFFDIVYGHFNAAGMEKEFYEEMSYICETTMLLATSKYIPKYTIINFIASLELLTVMGFDKNKIKAMENEILSAIKNKKVINMDEYIIKMKKPIQAD